MRSRGANFRSRRRPRARHPDAQSPLGYCYTPARVQAARSAVRNTKIIRWARELFAFSILPRDACRALEFSREELEILAGSSLGHGIF